MKNKAKPIVFLFLQRNLLPVIPFPRYTNVGPSVIPLICDKNRKF